MAESVNVGDKIRVARDNEYWNGTEGVVTGVGLPTHHVDRARGEILVDYTVTHVENHPCLRVLDQTGSFLSHIDVIEEGAGRVVEETSNKVKEAVDFILGAVPGKVYYAEDGEALIEAEDGSWIAHVNSDGDMMETATDTWTGGFSC